MILLFNSSRYIRCESVFSHSSAQATRASDMIGFPRRKVTSLLLHRLCIIAQSLRIENIECFVHGAHEMYMHDWSAVLEVADAVVSQKLHSICHRSTEGHAMPQVCQDIFFWKAKNDSWSVSSFPTQLQRKAAQHRFRWCCETAFVILSSWWGCERVATGRKRWKTLVRAYECSYFPMEEERLRSITCLQGIFRISIK